MFIDFIMLMLNSHSRYDFVRYEIINIGIFRHLSGTFEKKQIKTDKKKQSICVCCFCTKLV